MPTKVLDGQLPPHNLEAEEAVLGSCFIDFEALPKVAWLRPEDFFREKNQWVWAAMLRLHSEGKPTNQILVAHALAQEKSPEGISRLEAMGEAAYISYCISQTPTSIHVKYYADIVRDCSERRRQLTKANILAKEAYHPHQAGKKLKAIET